MFYTIVSINNFKNRKGGVLKLVSVKKKRDQSKDSMLRRFSRLVMDEGIIDEIKDRMYYKSPSLLKKEKNKEQEKKRRRSRD